MAKITIIVPTLNEEACLRNMLEHTFDCCYKREHVEVIVVDAGSDDNTVKSVEDMNVRVVSDRKLRGKKYASLNVGLYLSTSPVTMFLDADTWLPPSFDKKVLEVMTQRQVIGGAFCMVFHKERGLLRLLRRVNDLRYHFEDIYYGDQALFCDTQLAQDLGGYPKKALMESAFFCRILKKHGKLLLIPEPVVTSARRFKEHGIGKVVWFDLRMWFRFTVGLDVQAFAKKYWQHNQDINPTQSP